MYVVASDNRQISSASFECFAGWRQHRRAGELVLRQLAPECVQTREIVLESKHCVLLTRGSPRAASNPADTRTNSGEYCKKTKDTDHKPSSVLNHK